MSTDTSAHEPSSPIGSIDGRIDPEGVDRVQVGDVEIAYETFGRADDPAIVLVMGLGTQMIGWPDEFCEALAEAGHRVVRFDNRDVGLSTHIDREPPSLPSMLLRSAPPYRITDMAGDAVGLVDSLGIDRFHLVGASMGGFISQTVAIRHPERIRSLTLIMTSTGSRRVGRPTASVMRRMARQKPPTTRAEAIAHTVATYEVIGSPEHLDRDRLADLAGEAYDRGFDPSGRMRQLAAIMAQPDRTRALGQLKLPTLVVHGLNDPLVGVSGGLALAKAIPGARFVGHAGMGHDLPRSLWPALAGDILALVDRAEVEVA